jgi:TolA-binding protein
MFSRYRKRLMSLTAICISCLVLASFSCPAVLGETKNEAQQAKTPSTLAEIGAALEQARLLPASERLGAVKSIAGYLAAFEESDIPREKRCAVHFLSGEILYSLGDYGKAAEQFDNARKKSDEKKYEDDAVAARILAMEAAGEDDGAAREWIKWEKKYPDSPFVQEAYVARSWNALRRGQNAEAVHTLGELKRRFPWMKDDPRVVLADAAIAYLEGRYDDAIAALDSAEPSAGSSYLRALSYESQGSMLKAAAQYREVVERYRHSTLRDPAMLAKANIFLTSGAYKSAAEEMERVAEEASRADIRGEAMLRRAASVYLDGKPGEGAEMLRQVVAAHAESDLAARAQFLLGEILFEEEQYEEAIVEFNRVLANYFEHKLAPRAQYRIGRSLDALGRGAEATSTYQAVVAGYPLAPESPAAAYLAGAGLLQLGRPAAATPYFQLVLDRYAREGGTGELVFASEEHRELVEASLCLLEFSYHRAGNLGQLSGAPHMMLKRMPASKSPWRAYALLIDADALASQARYPEAETMLEQLIEEFCEHAIAVPATRLLAWNYAQQGQNELAIETEEKMLARYAAYGDKKDLSLAYFNKANILFNRKDYSEAAAAYDEFLRQYPEHPKHLQALYRAGLCYQRLDQNGDAVDRWEALVAADSTAEIAEMAWVRAGDLYFRAEHYEEAKRCYAGLLEHFAGSSASSLGMLRLAQCEYNAGRDEEALKRYSDVISRFPTSPYAQEAERGMELALYRLGQRENGSEVLTELVERYPTSSFAADAQFEIAMRSYKAEDFEKAAEEFRRVVSQFPGFSAADRAHFLMADAYRQAGLGRDARLAYEQFLAFFPESEFRSMVHFHLGSIRFEEGEYLYAAIDFTSILDEEAPKDISAAALFNLALCKRILGESEESRELLERYRREHSASDERAADIAYQLADIHDSAGRTEQAVEEYKAALGAKPAAPLETEIHYRIGLCREKLNDRDGALAAYRKAHGAKDKKDTFRLLAVARTAAIYEEQENYNGALAAYRDLIDNATDPELVVAAKERATQLEAIVE